MIAQGYQESGLDQAKRSHVGAIGVMQVMPTTARDKSVNIPDIDKLESNIHAGHQVQPLGDRQLLPGPRDHHDQPPAVRVRVLQRGAGQAWRACAGRRRPRASTPNKWFNNVELVAAKRIGRETVTYVSNIYKYYLAYQLMRKSTRSASRRWRRPSKR